MSMGQDDEDELDSDERWERICFKANVFYMDSNDIAGSQYAQGDVVYTESNEDERGYILGWKL